MRDDYTRDEEDRLVEDYRKQMLEKAAKERTVKEREQFLKDNGWVKSDGAWTAPWAFRTRRAEDLDKPIDRYVDVDLSHAYNAQLHEDRRQYALRQATDPQEAPGRSASGS